MLKDWEKTGISNAWVKEKTGEFVHAFKGHNKGIPTGNWIVRVGKTDEDLLNNQKKFKSKSQAMAYARSYMRNH